ncbi:hypothetical protein CI102_11087 [Trichoderma harzianum]|uniref:Uncharacterized protein n=1 Tax=Trichoderma harzianum CBS 226.95 TaxID=983964 RepID=A0A2T4AJT4_TRIHA|nr:hypothetical protein M431DRAFT_337045 [Trichoderma harzianum CBS 226.95]PKK43684.1 hypothetical protein CI102_11087 [Trichoderma harzianum]PTB57292.1 hypothetical protein M431DRAFT_337045 [Trichoderma harzianum CBS 226.95]
MPRTNARMYQFAQCLPEPRRDAFYFISFIILTTSFFIIRMKPVTCFVEPCSSCSHSPDISSLVHIIWLVCPVGWSSRRMYLVGVPECQGQKGGRRANQKQREKRPRNKEEGTRKKDCKNKGCQGVMPRADLTATFNIIWQHPEIGSC